MRSLWKDILFAVCFGIILPGILLNLFVWKVQSQENAEIMETDTKNRQLNVPEVAVLHPGGVKTSMELETYLTGVLLAEIPADFHMEALKAQAVAARTYTWKANDTGGKHGDGSICTDPSCCQSYMEESAYLSVGGNHEHLDKVRQAVSSTASMVIFYDGELIEATYFSSAGGSTEAAAAVWGADYPYLQPVSSPEEPAVVTLRYSMVDFCKLLGIVPLKEDAQWFGPITYTDGGGVDTIEIGGEVFSGVWLRTLLGLRSTAFEIEEEDGDLRIITKGFGHRVGMSQYGANTMAEQGSTWQKILQHYYPGTTVAPAY